MKVKKSEKGIKILCPVPYSYIKKDNSDDEENLNLLVREMASLEDKYNLKVRIAALKSCRSGYRLNPGPLV